jgi:hypothetical protein
VRKQYHGRTRKGLRIELLEARRLLSSITGVSDPFSVTDQLTFISAQTVNVKAGSLFSASVQAVDGTGMPDPSFNGVVTLSDRYSSYYDSPLDGKLTATAVNGVATFTGISQEMPTSESYWAEGDKLYANSGAMPRAESAPFDIYEDHLKFLTQPPSEVTAGTAFTLKVGAMDESGDLDTSFEGKVVLSDRYSFRGYGLQGDLTVSAVDGVATFSGISEDIASTDDLGQEGIYAYGWYEGMPNAYSNSFTVNASDATQLDFTNVPVDANGNALTNEPLTVEVTAEDQYGNLATGFNGNISVALGDNPAGATLGGTTTVAASRGVATFKDVTISATGSGFTMIASGVGSATSDSFDVRDQLVFTTQPSGQVIAGAPFTVVVEAEDGAGNVDSSFHGSITLSDTYSDNYNTSLDGTLTIQAVNGVATFSKISQSFTTSSGYYHELDRLEADSDTGLSINSNPFAVVEAGGDTLVFSTQPPDSVVLDSPFSVAVTAIDSAGKIDSSFAGLVTLDDLYSENDDGGLSGIQAINAVNGVATFPAVYQGTTTNYAGENDVLYASADGTAPATSTAFSVVSGDHFVVSEGYSYYSRAYAGQPLSVMVTAEDASGNIDQSFNGPVTISDLYSKEYPAASLKGTLTVKAVDGVANFDDVIQNLSSDQATNNDSDALFASGPGYPTGASPTFWILPSNEGEQLVFTAQPPASIAVGATFTVAVSLEDSSGNVVSSFDGSIDLSTSDGSALNGTLSVSANHGVATFSGLSFSDPTDGTWISLDASANGLDNSSNAFVINSGQVSQLAFVGLPVDANDYSNAALLNAPLKFTVQAEDSKGNPVSSFNGNISLTLGSSPTGATLGGTTTLAAVDGVASFTDSTLDARGSYTLVAAAGPTSVTSDSFTVSDQLVFTTQPPAVLKQNEPFSVVVKAEDGLGVVDSTMSGDVTLSDEYGSYYYNNTLGGTLTVKAIDGVATFTGISESGTFNGDFLQASGDGLQQGTSSEFAVEADQMVFTSAPTSATAGQPFDATVEIDNPTGGIDSSFNGSVTLSDDYASDYSQASPLKGTLTVKAVNGIASFSGISQTLASETAGYEDTLYASSDGLNNVSSDAFNIAAGAAAKLTFVGAPADTNGDGGIVAKSKLSVQVAATDAYGNVDTHFSGNVTLTLGANPSGASLAGATTAALTSGIASFNDLTISAVGDGYTLIANADGSDTTASDRLAAMRIGHL